MGVMFWRGGKGKGAAEQAARIEMLLELQVVQLHAIHLAILRGRPEFAVGPEFDQFVKDAEEQMKAAQDLAELVGEACEKSRAGGDSAAMAEAAPTLHERIRALRRAARKNA